MPTDDKWNPLVPTPFLVSYGQIPSDASYAVDFQRDMDTGTRYKHSFCGPNDLPNAVCPNCTKPLLRFLSIDTHDTRLGLSDVANGQLSLYYCWTCNVAQAPFYYSMTEDGGVTLLEYGPGGACLDFPYVDYPTAFPGAPAVLLEMTGEAQRLIQAFHEDDEFTWEDIPEGLRYLIDCRHQIGGEPFLIQRNPEEQMACCRCHRRMPFLAAIGDDCLDARGFTGNVAVQVLYFYCTNCHVIGAFQQCD